jgi:hypothetical protein
LFYLDGFTGIYAESRRFGRRAARGPLRSSSAASALERDELVARSATRSPAGKRLNRGKMIINNREEAAR